MMKDPVCDMIVDEKTSKLKSEHEGTRPVSITILTEL